MIVERAYLIAVGGAVVLSVLGVVLASRCNAGSRAVHELERRDEAEQLRDVGVVVAEVAQDLAPELMAAWGKIDELQAEVARVRKAAPGAKPVSVSTSSTGPVPVQHDPAAVEAAGAGQGPGGETPPPSPGPACVLREGDTGEVRVAEVRLETDAGNHILAGAAEAWRISPAPAQRLFGGALRADLGAATERTPPPNDAQGGGWGAGPALGVSDRGWLAGATVVTPTVRVPLLGWRLGLVASGAGGPGGATGIASLVVRP